MVASPGRVLAVVADFRCERMNLALLFCVQTWACTSYQSNYGRFMTGVLPKWGANALEVASAGAV